MRICYITHPTFQDGRNQFQGRALRQAEAKQSTACASTSHSILRSKGVRFGKPKPYNWTIYTPHDLTQTFKRDVGLGAPAQIYLVRLGRGLARFLFAIALLDMKYGNSSRLQTLKNANLTRASKITSFSPGTLPGTTKKSARSMSFRNATWSTLVCNSRKMMRARHHGLLNPHHYWNAPRYP